MEVEHPARWTAKLKKRTTESNSRRIRGRGCVGSLSRPLGSVAFSMVPFDDWLCDEPGKNGERERADESSNEQRLANRGQQFPISPKITAEMEAFYARPVVGLAEQPIADVVLPQVNYRHRRQDYVVKSTGEDGGENVRASEPGEQNGEERLKSKERHEAEKNADGDTASDGFRSVTDGEQLE